MSKKQLLTLVLAMTALTAEIAFAAQIPANVQKVRADMTSGSLTVSWAPVANAAFYRVYYSHESILENQGNYDDFERTIARETTYTFAKVPVTSPKVFVSVLAVNATGEESEGFEMEASVDQPQAMPASANPAPAVIAQEKLMEHEEMPQGENPTTTAEPMTIASVVSLSSTGVLVTFSKSIREGASINPAFFVITDSGGIALRINWVSLNGPTALLTTNTQVPARDYTFALILPVPAGDGTNALPSTPRIAFRGFGEPVMEQPAAEVPVQTEPKQHPTPPPPQTAYGQNPLLGGPIPMQGQGGIIGPTFLDLQATPRQDGTYDVIARWNGMPNVQNYGLYTAVNGQPYVWNSQVGANETTVQYSRVYPGTFAVKVTARNQGQESRGVERALDLPTTGIGVLGLMAIAGGAAGARLRRRRKTV